MSQTSTELSRFALTFAAASERGQTAAITALLEKHDAYIEEFTVFDDVLSGRFFLRTVFRLVEATDVALAALRDGYAGLRNRFREPEGQIHDLKRPMRVLLMVSRADHCLRDLLDQWRRHELEMDIVAVASNHLDLGPLVIAEGLPFHHLPITPDTKPQQEAALLELIESTGAELVVLARYMQVLSATMCERLAGRVINIHHSFLPGFKGARPYEQAHARGVKLIGATAHFATIDLDEGPIIEQVIERVDHAYSPEQLLSTGRHVECLTLGRALRYVLERRVFINGLRTVVLR
ncbi:MAG: formyltetrahydrofolate deformylase [Paraburkholderia sp.]|uniref:formyltetrahydrofolate deformylase n=1 Tax=Paraburkholderia sp. TaxID=1926495 RepID=UPI0012259ADA|nr:formyltetrahydrofolate deformylase [Paraburkholderia sp.]TAM08411.1 MAG: formyltetrahydrofolate deformylase [Paraburkholderia sp.]